MSDPEATLSLIARENEHLDRSRRVELVSEEVKVSVLRDRFAAFMENLQTMLDVPVADELPFALDEIQFSAEITANGEFKLLGTGVGVAVGSAVTFVLKRREQN